MLYVACPSCGERGKVPPTLVGARISVRSVALVSTSRPRRPRRQPWTEQRSRRDRQRHRPPEQPTGGFAVDGLEASAWAVASDQRPDLLKADAGPSESAEVAHAFEAHNSTGFKEYKVLWSRDKISSKASSTWLALRSP